MPVDGLRPDATRQGSAILPWQRRFVPNRTLVRERRAPLRRSVTMIQIISRTVLLTIGSALLLLGGCGDSEPYADSSGANVGASAAEDVAAPADAAPAESPAANEPAATTDTEPDVADASDADTSHSDASYEPPAAEPIRFPSNATSVTLDGSLPPGRDKRYSIRASAGQPARVSLRGSGAAVAFNLYAPGGGPGGEALVRGSRSGGTYRGTLPNDGTYLLQIYRTGAEADAPAPYRLTVRIDPVADDSTLSGAPAARPAQAITDYYGALERGDYAAAYRQWGNDGAASGQSFAKFRKGFENTRHTDVVIGKATEPEGAAGSLYVTIPVTVNAVLKDRTRQSFSGEYVLRRVNDVPGSSQTDRRWHLHSASLKPAN